MASALSRLLDQLKALLGRKPEPAPTPAPAPVANPKLLGELSFNDTKDWTVRYGRWGAPGGELQYYTDKNHSIDSGQLVIKGRNEAAPDGGHPWTSTRMATIGKVELKPPIRIVSRIWLSGTPGAWGALWMRGIDKGDDTWPNKGEIDILELPLYGPIAESSRIRQANLHGPRKGNPSADAATNGLGNPAPVALTDKWQEWGIDWYPDRIIWHLNGNQFASVTKAQYENQFGGTWIFDGRFPFYLIVNLAIGGWGGTPQASAFPATMKVDWIRAYSL